MGLLLVGRDANAERITHNVQTIVFELLTEHPVNGGRNSNDPKVAKFLAW